MRAIFVSSVKLGWRFPNVKVLQTLLGLKGEVHLRLDAPIVAKAPDITGPRVLKLMPTVSKDIVRAVLGAKKRAIVIILSLLSGWQLKRKVQEKRQAV